MNELMRKRLRKDHTTHVQMQLASMIDCSQHFKCFCVKITGGKPYHSMGYGFYGRYIPGRTYVSEKHLLATGELLEVTIASPRSHRTYLLKWFSAPLSPHLPPHPPFFGSQNLAPRVGLLTSQPLKFHLLVFPFVATAAARTASRDWPEHQKKCK